MSQNRILSRVGLATKAGKTVSGEFLTEKEIKSGRKVPIYFYQDKDTLGHAMGKQFRASLAILDEGFAKGIKEYLDTESNVNCIEEVV